MKKKILPLLLFFIFYFFNLETSFTQENQEDSICKDYFYSARKYFYKDHDSALYFTQLIEKTANEYNNERCLAIALSCYGTIYRNSGKYLQSLNAFDSSLALFKSLNDSIWEARTILMIGSVYSEKGDYLKSIELLMESSRKYEGLTDEWSVRSRSRVKNFIGIAYYQLGDKKNALVYFKESLADSKSLMDTSSFISPLSNIGMLFSDLGNYSEALKHYEMARAIAVKTNNYLNEAQIVGNIGNVYFKLGDYHRSIQNRLQALKMVKELNQTDEITRQYLGIAKSNFELKDFKVASRYADSSYTLAKKIQAKDQIKEALEFRIELQLALNNPEASIPLFQELILVKDSILNQEKIKQIAALEVEFETEKKELKIENQEKELMLLSKEKEVQRLYYIGFSMLLFLGSGLLFLLYNRQKLKATNAEMKKQIVQQNLKQSELKNIQLQQDIDVHQQEITAITLSMIRKNEQIERLKNQISKLDQNDSKAIELKRKMRDQEIADIDWNNFNAHFSKIHPEFYNHLLNENANITQNEMRTAALIKMNLSNREIASITGVNVRSVDQTKYRLKKKIAQDSEKSLVELIRSI
ncbi:tetratricopeptide repeat protein [bacterium]|nr:tetratricopeptide repeat protein [bacterium]